MARRHGTKESEGTGSEATPFQEAALADAAIHDAAFEGPLANAFDGDFLDRLLERDQPPTAASAAVAGPWEVRGVPGYGWGVYRLGDGAEPAARLAERQDALVVAAALPGSARHGAPRLDAERGPDGYRLHDGGREMGRLAWFDIDLVAAVGALRHLVATPRSLALLLEAAGHDALEQAGRILARHARRPG